MLHNALRHFTALQVAFQKAVGERDAQFAGIERAGETLTPVIDLWSLPEWAYLRGERLGWGNAALGAAGAGIRSNIQLLNPAGSRMIVVVESVIAGSGTAAVQPLLWRYDTALTTLTTTVQPRDTRNPAIRILTQLRTQNVALPGGAVLLGRMIQTVVEAAAGYAYFDQPIVLAPGTGIFVAPGTDNQGLSAMFTWRERLAVPGELE